jgi:hypothetical protein
LIQLETTDESLIRKIYDVIYFNDRYYVFDGRQEKILCFDSTGKYLFKILQKGQGPEEYVTLTNFNIDSYNNQLLLLEHYGSLLTFDLEGKFISKIRLPAEIGSYSEVFVIDQNSLLFSSMFNRELVFYDKINNITYDRRYAPDSEVISKSVNLFSITTKTYKYNGNLFFSPPPSNEIINLSDSTIFSWNFGKLTNTKETIERLKDFILRSEGDFRPQRPYFTYDWVGEKLLHNVPLRNFETSRYIATILNCGRGCLRHVFFDKQTGKAIVFSKTTEGICFSSPIFNDESMITYNWDHPIDDNLDRRLSHLYYHPSIFTEKQRQLYESRKEDDNPFLVKYNFKQ